MIEFNEIEPLDDTTYYLVIKNHQTVGFLDTANNAFEFETWAEHKRLTTEDLQQIITKLDELNEKSANY